MSAAVPDRRSVAQKAALATEIVVLYTRARRLLRGDDIRRALQDLRDEPLLTGEPLSVVAARRLAGAVTKTLRVIPLDTRCLIQSLVLSAALARRSTPTRLVIAVRPGEEFVAHAWVELDGLPLLPTGEPEFQRLAEL
jgi:hypothetical protein